MRTFLFLLLLLPATLVAQDSNSPRFRLYGGKLEVQAAPNLPWAPVSTTSGTEALTKANAALAALPAKTDTATFAALRDLPIMINDHLLHFWQKAVALGPFQFIARLGDSVAPSVADELERQMLDSAPQGALTYPNTGNNLGGLNVAYSGGMVYQGGYWSANQDILNGVISGTNLVGMTRSGSTVTVTLDRNYGQAVGQYITIAGAAQAEYNGFYQITAVTTNTVSYTISGTPTSPATGSPTLYGLAADFTYLPSGEHIEMPTSSTLTFDANQAKGYSQWRTFLATGPGMGSATVELLNNSTGGVISTTAVSLSGASLDAIEVTMPISTTLSGKVRITASGKVVHLYTIAQRAAGTQVFAFNRGGSSFTQNLYSSATIHKTLFEKIPISLAIVTAKEEGFPGSMAPLVTRLNSFTGTSKLLVGSLPDSGPDASQVFNNNLMRRTALANNYGFIDARRFYGDVNPMQKIRDLGYRGGSAQSPDEVHLAGVAGSVVAAWARNRLMDTRAYGQERRDIFSANATVGNLKLIDETQTSGTTGNVISLYGGGDPGKVRIDNVRTMQFGSTNAQIGPYGSTGIAVQNAAGNDFGDATLKNARIRTSLSTDAAGAKVTFGHANSTLEYATGTAGSCHGTATLSSGQVTVTTTCYGSPNSLYTVFPTYQGASGTLGRLDVTPTTGGFIIKSMTDSNTLNTADNSVVGWIIVKKL